MFACETSSRHSQDSIILRPRGNDAEYRRTSGKKKENRRTELQHLGFEDDLVPLRSAWTEELGRDVYAYSGRWGEAGGGQREGGHGVRQLGEGGRWGNQKRAYIKPLVRDRE